MPLSVLPSSSCTVSAGGVAVTAQVTSFSVKQNSSTQVTETLTDVAYGPGSPAAGFDVGLVFDEADGGVETLFSAQAAKTSVAMVVVVGELTFTGSTQYVESVTIDGSANGVVEASLSTAGAVVVSDTV